MTAAGLLISSAASTERGRAVRSPSGIRWRRCGRRHSRSLSDPPAKLPSDLRSLRGECSEEIQPPACACCACAARGQPLSRRARAAMNSRRLMIPPKLRRRHRSGSNELETGLVERSPMFASGSTWDSGSMSELRVIKIADSLAPWILMSALPPIADIRRLGCDVRFVPIADIGRLSRSPRRRARVASAARRARAPWRWSD